MMKQLIRKNRRACLRVLCVLLILVIAQASVAATFFNTSDFAAAMSEAVKPRAKIRRADWIAQNIRIPSRSSPTAGRFNFDRHPYAREIFDAMDDPRCREIVLKWATQLGKGETTLAGLAAQCVLDPGQSMFAGGDRDYVQEQRDRFAGICRETRALANLIAPQHRLNLRSVSVGESLIYLAWSGNPQRLSGRSTPFILCSEVDRWTHDASEASSQSIIRERFKAWADLGYTIIWEGAPTDENSFMEERFLAGDMRRLRVPCPHCGRFQILRHFPIKSGEYAGQGGLHGIQDEQGNYLDAEEARQKAYYQCLNGCRIEEHERLPMLRRGVWAPDGMQVSAAGQLTGAATKPGSVWSYELNSLYAPSLSFGENAFALVESRKDPQLARNFTNNWMALKHAVDKRKLKAEVFASEHAGRYHRGQIPAGAYFVTVGVDVQKACVYWVARAWGDARTSWYVDDGVIGDPDAMIDDDEASIAENIAANLLGLDDVLARTWPMAAPNKLGMTALGVQAMAIDTGYYEASVLDYVARKQADHGVMRVMATKGDGGIEGAVPFRQRTVHVDPHTHRISREKNALVVWHLKVSHYRDFLRNFAWIKRPHEPGAWHLPNDIWPARKRYLQQVINEGQKTEIDKKTGRKKLIWHIIDNRLGNHPWDCEVYNAAIADLTISQRWDLDRQVAAHLAAKEQDAARQWAGFGEEHENEFDARENL